MEGEQLQLVARCVWLVNAVWMLQMHAAWDSLWSAHWGQQRDKMNVKFAPHFSWHIAMAKRREEGGLVRVQTVALHVNKVDI